MSEFTILRAAIGQGDFWIGAMFLVMLLVIFVGMGATVLAVAQGEPPPESPASLGKPRFRDSVFTVAPVIAFMALVVMLGLWIPAPLAKMLHEAATFLDAGAT